MRLYFHRCLNSFPFGRKAALLLLMAWGSLTGIGQVNIINTETMYNGTGGSTGDLISVHETNDRFENDALSMSGTGDMRTSSVSSGYVGSSGAWNVMLNGNNEYFQVSGINTSGYSSIVLSFGFKQAAGSATAADFAVEVSADGSTWSPLTVSFVSNTNWYLNIPTGTIPSTSNLRIRFINKHPTISWDFRIDDFKLTGIFSCPVLVSSFSPASGPVGTEVTISGSGFTGATSVSFNGITASVFTVKTDNTIVATVPAGATTGNISVFNSCSAISSTSFTVINTSCAYNGNNLIISELCDPQNNYTTDRYIEIYNPTSTAIDLTGWSVRAISNGDINVSCLQWPLSGQIQSGQALTCGYTSPLYGGMHTFTNSEWWTSVTNSNLCNYNWNGQQRDGATLYNGSTRIDGILKADNGTYWYDNKSLVRNADICSPNPNSADTEWSTSSIVNNAGTAPSTPRSHTVNCIVSQPVVTLQPLPQSFCVNQSGSLSVAATGGQMPYNYVWKVYTGSGTWQTVTNSAIYGGATTSTLSLANLPVSFDGYQFYCEIYNQDNSCYKATNAAIIHVSNGPLLVVTNPAIACTPATVNLTAASVTAGSTLGGATLSYWQNATCTLLLNNPGLVSVSGTYYIKASAGAGCDNIQEVEVTINPSPVAPASASSNPMILCADDPGNIVLTANGGSGSVLEWFEGTCSGTPIGNVNNLSISSPTVTTTYFARWTSPGCGSSLCASVQISVNAAPVITNIASTPASCGNDNGSLVVTASGGIPPDWSYSKDNGVTWQSSSTFLNLPAGPYYIKVKDNNCESPATIATVTLSGSTIAYTVSHLNVECYGDNDGTATVSGTGGVGTLSYSWNTIPVQTSTTAINLIAGIYICTITDGASCSIDVSVEITQPLTALAAGITSHTDVDCNGNNNATAEVYANGGTAPYTFSWNTIPAQTGPIAINLTAGSHTCTVEDDEGCTIQVFVNISQPVDALSASISALNGVSCSGGTDGSATVMVVGGTTAYEYEWNTVPAQYTTTATNLPAGNYICHVKDAHGCTANAYANIPQPTALTGNITSQTSSICTGATNGTATVSANGGTPGYTYYWGNTTPPQTSATAINLSVGTYICTITDFKGCTKEVTAIITAYAQPSSAEAGEAQNVCGMVATLNGNDPLVGTGQWSQVSGPATLTITNPTSYNTTVSTTAPGTFVLQWTITSEPSCPSSSDQVTIQLSNTVTVTVGYNSPVCEGDDIQLTSSISGATYLWNGPGGFTDTIQNPVILNSTPANSGPYTVKISDIPNNCPDVNGNTTVAVNLKPLTQPISSTNVTAGVQDVCIGNQFPYTIQTPALGSLFNWNLSGGGTIIDPNNSNLIHINWTMAGGPYLVSVTETTVDGCTGEPVSISVTVNTPSTAGVIISTASNLSCDGLPVTFKAIPASGGTTPQFTWYVNGIPRPFTGLPTFTYLPSNGDTVQASLSSSSICALPNPVFSDSIVMSVGLPSVPSISISADNNPSCAGTTIFFSSDTSQAGTMPTFQWKKNGTNVGTNSTTYSDNTLATNDVISCILISDAVCASPASDTSNLISLTIKPTPVISVSDSINPGVCGAKDGTITLGVLIPAASYLVNYAFNGTPVTKTISADPAGIVPISGLGAGNYSNITVTLNGCSSAPIIKNLSDPGATAAPTILSYVDSICPGLQVGLEANGCADSVTWSNGLHGSIVYVSPTVNSTYTATCTFNGCVSAASNPVNIIVKARPVISGYTVTPPLTYCSQDGIIILKGLIPNTVYTAFFTYDTISVTHSGNTLANGWYQISGCKPTTYFDLTVMLDGCKSDSLDVVVPASTLPQPPLITSPEDTVCPGQTVILTALGCSGLVTWSDGTTGPTLTTTLAASLAFTATCTESSCKSASGIPLMITVAPAEFETIAGNANVCNSGLLQLDAVGSALSCQWTLPDGSLYSKQSYLKDSITVNDSGFYHLVSIDNKGCSDADSIKVAVNPLPVINISAGDTLCAGSTHVLEAGAGYNSYLWQDGPGLSSYPARDAGVYWVIVTDTNGCMASDTAWLTYCPSDIYFPTAFSPNNIGVNERFKPVAGSIVLLDYSMTIYNRWGQKLYETGDYTTGWDGTLNGSVVPPGSYGYVVSYKTSDPAKPGASGKVMRRGTVMLVR